MQIDHHFMMPTSQSVVGMKINLTKLVAALPPSCSRPLGSTHAGVEWLGGVGHLLWGGGRGRRELQEQRSGQGKDRSCWPEWRPGAWVPENRCRQPGEGMPIAQIFMQQASSLDIKYWVLREGFSEEGTLKEVRAVPAVCEGRTFPAEGKTHAESL